MMSLPTYSKPKGTADLMIRNKELVIVIQWLVCHTNLKNAGRLRSASRRSLKVMGSGFVFFGGRVFNIISFC